MKNYHGPIAAVILMTSTITANPAWAGKAPKLSGLALQQVQSRDIEAPKAITFPATMSVLQDAGYRIGSADVVTGIITATASTKTKMTWMPFVGFGTSKKSPIVSVFIEDMGPGMSRVRLNFVMGKLKNGIIADEDPIYDTATYNDAFEKINQAVFIRQAMINRQAPAPAAAVQPLPAQSIIPAETPTAVSPAAPTTPH